MFLIQNKFKKENGISTETNFQKKKICTQTKFRKNLYTRNKVHKKRKNQKKPFPVSIVTLEATLSSLNPLKPPSTWEW